MATSVISYAFRVVVRVATTILQIAVNLICPDHTDQSHISHTDVSSYVNSLRLSGLFDRCTREPSVYITKIIREFLFCNEIINMYKKLIEKIQAGESPECIYSVNENLHLVLVRIQELYVLVRMFEVDYPSYEYGDDEKKLKMQFDITANNIDAVYLLHELMICLSHCDNAYATPPSLRRFELNQVRQSSEYVKDILNIYPLNTNLGQNHPMVVRFFKEVDELLSL